MAIQRGTLKEIGEVIGRKKMDFENGTFEKEELTKEEEEKMIEYCLNDTRIVLDFVLQIKEKLGKEGVNLKRIFTVSQIAVAYLLKKLAGS